MGADTWHVYMLECRGGRIYVGVARDLARRYAAHAAGKGAAFTRMHPPDRILGSLSVASRSEALRLEYRLKQLSPRKKRLWAEDPVAAAWASSGPAPSESG